MLLMLKPAIAKLAYDFAGQGLVASGMLLALAQEVVATPPEQAITSIASIVASALTVGGIGYFLIQTATKEWTKARDEQRVRDKEERENERQREASKEAFQLAQVQLWQQAFSDERKRNETLVSEFMERVSCIPTFPTKPPA